MLPQWEQQIAGSIHRVSAPLFLHIASKKIASAARNYTHCTRAIVAAGISYTLLIAAGIKPPTSCGRTRRANHHDWGMQVKEKQRHT